MQSKFLTLWGRVFRRIFRASSRVRGVKVFILTIIALVGIYPPKFWQSWLSADSDHRFMAVLGFFLVLILLGAYEAEKELDDYNVLRLEPLLMREARVVASSNLGGAEIFHNVLCLGFSIDLINASDKTYSAQFPALVLLRRRSRWKRWKPLAIKLAGTGAHARGGPKGSSKLTAWDSGRRLEIPERDEILVDFSLAATSLEEAGSFLNAEMKMHLTVELTGHDRLFCEISIPRILAVEESRKASSGQSPRSQNSKPPSQPS